MTVVDAVIMVKSYCCLAELSLIPGIKETMNFTQTSTDFWDLS